MRLLRHLRRAARRVRMRLLRGLARPLAQPRYWVGRRRRRRPSPWRSWRRSSCPTSISAARPGSSARSTTRGDGRPTGARIWSRRRGATPGCCPTSGRGPRCSTRARPQSCSACSGFAACGARSAPPAGRDHIVFYASVVAIAFWASFGPDAGLYRWLYDTHPRVRRGCARRPRFGLVCVLGLGVLGGFAVARWASTRAQAGPCSAPFSSC